MTHFGRHVGFGDVNIRLVHAAEINKSDPPAVPGPVVRHAVENLLSRIEERNFCAFRIQRQL
jgi:hypothetical protein